LDPRLIKLYTGSTSHPNEDSNGQRVVQVVCFLKPLEIRATKFIHTKLVAVFREVFASNTKSNCSIIFLSLTVVVVGMFIGKYGAGLGLPWWLYYPIPMLMTLLLPPILLKLNKRRTAIYLVLSFISAPFVHFIFSFFLDWHEYMPFWKIPYINEI
jgi:hypothetical protein